MAYFVKQGLALNSVPQASTRCYLML